MEIAKSFGLDPFLFGAQVINFLIIFYLLKRFLYKPVLTILKKREDTIKEGLKQAEEAKLLYEKTVEKEKDILRKAKDEAKIMIDEAKNQSLELSQKIQEDTKKQAEKILANAQNQITLETKEAEKRLTVKITELSLDFLKNSLKEMFSESQQKEVLEKALKQIGKSN